MSTDDPFNEVILTLYRSCREISARDFKEWAMELVRRTLIPFDSGFWGTTGGVVTHEFDSVYLFNQPFKILEDYERNMEGLKGDLMGQVVLANPGKTIDLIHVIPMEEWVNHPIYVRHCRQYGISHALSTSHVSPVTQIPGAISFYRADLNNPFSETERRTKELLTPHLIEAMRINLFASLQAENVQPGEALALCDSRGALYETTSSFPDLMRTVQPDWCGPRLETPCEILDSTDSTRWSANGLKFEASPYRDLFLVRAARESALDRLSPRQLAVAELLARGKRYKEIGRELGISPSTVTNHVNHIHEKLGIEKREELIALFNRES